MGMFDYIVPECELPMPVPAGLEWQTKDTPAQFLDTYRITADGQLIHRAYTIETVPESERDDLGLPLWRRVNQHDEPCDFTGSIEFYGGGGPNRDVWYAFCAPFERGKLLKVVAVDHPDMPDAEANT